jgi:phage recombination protein Bet
MAKEAAAKARIPVPEKISDSNDAPKAPVLTVAPFLNAEQRELLREEYGEKFTKHQLSYFFEICERAKLDPFLREIWPITRQAKDEEGRYQPRMIIITTVTGFRVNADRTSLCDGESPVQWCGRNGQWQDVWLQPEPPAAARVSVYRKDRSRPQVAVVNWDAFCPKVYNKQGQEVPTSFWLRMGPHMLGKVAIAQAYRGAFPQMANVFVEEEVPEVLDPDSEAGIEAEMTRRYIRDAEYWEKQKELGHYPAGQQPPLPQEEKAPEATVSDVSKTRHFSEMPLPPESPFSEPAKPIARIQVQPDPRADWRDFPIERIKTFKGRTIGSLSSADLTALTPWLERVKETWGSVDNDIRAHYTALMQRIKFDQETAVVDAESATQMDLDSYAP